LRPLHANGLGGSILMGLPNFVDALHFASLEESIGLQQADAAALVIKRQLMGKPDPDGLYAILKPCLVVNPVSASWPLPEDAEP
jgi:hypothetical protein